MTASLKVVSIHESNFRDVISSLRELADQIEQGDFGEVTTVGVALLGETFEIFGMGPNGDPCDVALLFNAANLRFAKTIEEIGRL